MFLPDSPRYFVKRGYLERAANSLSRLRGQPVDSEYIQNELAEIVANEEYERSLIPSTGIISSWLNCFKGSLWDQKSNVRRTILGTSMQMMQQWYVLLSRSVWEFTNWVAGLVLTSSSTTPPSSCNPLVPSATFS
jgi:hypothetical protein